MPHAPFVHLRVHSAYSLSEGALRVPEIVRLCQQDAMPAVAITDTNNLFGALEFATTCAKAGVQPVIGCQLSVATGLGGGRRQVGGQPVCDKLVLLAQSERGYANLLALVSRAHLDTAAGEEPHVALGNVLAGAGDLICLSGGPAGPVGRLLLEGQAGGARDLMRTLADAFGDRLYVELMRHGLDEEDRIEGALVDLAYGLDLPLVATNEAFFATSEMYQAHDALVCVAEGKVLEARDRRRLTPEHRFKSSDEMRAQFADLPEAVDNTAVVARRCAFMPEPRAPILPNFPTLGGSSESDELRRQASAGLARRLADHVVTEDMDATARAEAAEPYEARLEYEIGIIERMGFPGYFLIVADFIGWAKERGIPVGPGRGSGAGSVVAWSLGITDLDPLRWGLLFERFLNPERISMPDFDVDFCQERRDEVIRYVQEKYGRDRVAQIITFGKLQARAVLRDVGRVLGMPYGQVDRICKLVPFNPANPVKLQQAIDEEPQLQDMRENDETVRRLLDMALKLEGLYRHASTHAAGLVIGDRPLHELVPLYRDPRSEMPVTQFDMKSVEKAGLVKFDFLGLKTLSVIAKAKELLRRRGIDIDETKIPLDDRSTFEMLSRGEATGVFQMESSGMRDVLRRLRPDRFEDLIAVVALYRPGPMSNIPRYIACKHGEEQPDYMHPSLEPVLKETFGIMIYQEQVMRIAQDLSGFSLGHADLLRRAMGKKIKEEMAAQRKAFIDGARNNGVPEAKAAEIFDQVDRFAGYGFNKSHAAAYALVAYQTAYLKANYPVEFMAALMSFDIQNTDKLAAFRQELDRISIGLLPPDINRSESSFSVEYDDEDRGAVRYALSALKNVGGHAMESLVAEREAHGPFRSLGDLCARVDARALNKRMVESLAAAGAFDSLMPNRRRIVEGVDRLIRHAAAAADERTTNQQNLFGDAAPQDDRDLGLPLVEDWPVIDRLRHEFDAVGFYLSAHPLDAYGKSLERIGVVSSAELAAAIRPGEARRVKLAGTFLGKQERTSRTGKRFAFIQMSDARGVFEVMVFSEVLGPARELLEAGEPLLVTVDGRHEDDQIRLIGQGFERLDDAVAHAAAGLRIYLRDEAVLPNLASVIERQQHGRGRVSVIVDVEDREVEILLGESFRISAATRGAIKSIPGILDVRDL